MNRSKKIKLLKKLKAKMENDDTLPLKECATSLVFGSGNPDTQILFIGEGPGYWEDQKSVPFVGNAGKLLDNLLYSIKLDRKDVFITNVVHHRPPDNRDPLPEEIKAYGEYLDNIIKIIAPKAIVTLGRFSMAKFIPNVKISSVHGKRYEVSWEELDLIVVPMYHPAAGLRSLDIKQKLMDDFKNLPDLLKEEKRKNKDGEEKRDVEQMNLI
jgi:DNA polymerase